MNLFIQSNHPQNGQLTFFTWLCTCYIITHFSIFDNFIAHKYKYLLQKVKKKTNHFVYSAWLCLILSCKVQVLIFASKTLKLLMSVFSWQLIWQVK